MNNHHKFLKKLSGEKRARFYKTAIVVAIFFTIAAIGLLYFFNFLTPLDKSFIFFLVVIYLGLYVNSMRIVYINMTNDDELL